MRIAHIDADVLAVQAAIVNQKATRWDDEEDPENALWTLHAFEADGERTFDHMVTTISSKVGADKTILAFSDKVNWRKKVLPTYKSNRANAYPMLLRKHLVEYGMANYESRSKETLEGDDVLGIYATMPQPKDVEIVTCSIDKDMKTFPGFHYNFGRDDIFEVKEFEADYWHLYQALMGDTVDGYSGCPGIGPKTAVKLLDKFLTETSFDVQGAWEAVVKAFDKAGLCEEEALVQARVARICRASDYDFKKKEVILWTPSEY